MKKLIYCLLFLFVSNSMSAQQLNKDMEKSMQQAWQYLNGINCPLDATKAFNLHMQCAKEGNARAMNALGVQYQKGLGISQNSNEAEKWFKKAIGNGYTKAYYNLGMLYKYSKEPDYEKAYKYFCKSADLQEPIGWYSKGYMLYKGYGCTQNYTEAYYLFKKGALKGSAASMYFMGLCLRNGYGIEANIDSARYWISQSAKLGYNQAAEELTYKDAENNTIPAELVNKIKAFQAPNQLPVNKYTKVTNIVQADEIEGDYTGYLLKYDWSGKNIIHSSKLSLTLTNGSGELTGKWTEEDSITVDVNAQLTKKAILFKNMQYSRTDHYNPIKPVVYDFQEAKLQLTKNGDTVFLAGNVQLYKPNQKEPSKPIYVVLMSVNKKASKRNTNLVALSQVSTTESKLLAYPNPFSSIINIDFDLKETCKVFTQLFSLDGKLLYTNPSEKLPAGSYTLPVQVNLPAGSYVIKLHYGKQEKSAIIMKQ